jgi:hypothetical protein
MNYVLWHNVWHDVAFPNMSARANTPATAKCAAHHRVRVQSP